MGERWFQRATRDRPRLTKFTNGAVAAVFESRSIDEKVWRGRRYVPYDAGDWDTVVQADPLLETLIEVPQRSRDGVRNVVRGWVNQRPGLVMQRHPIPGAPALYAQLRPFKFADLDPAFELHDYVDLDEDPKIYNGTEWHVHTRMFEHEHTATGEVRRTPSPIGEDAAARLRDRRDRRLREIDDLPHYLRKSTRNDRGWLLEHIVEQHDRSAPAPGVVHAHRLSWQDHRANPDYAAEHCSRCVAGERREPDHSHDGLIDGKWHGHDSFMKYCYYPRVPTSVVDVHPKALPLLEAGGQRAFFCLEGLLKNDAVLSRGVPVVNVGSVTLWRDPDLARLFPYLRRFKQLVVVADSDWLGNDAVYNQAQALASVLRSKTGADIIVAAPPANKKCGYLVCPHLTRYIGHDRWLPEEGHKNGVDDWLGPEEGGNLDDMLAVRMTDTTKEEKLQQVVKKRIDQFERDNALLEYYSKVATPSGYVRQSMRNVAHDVWGTTSARMAALRGTESLVDQGLIERVHLDDTGDEFVKMDQVTTTIRISQELRETPETFRLGEL